jgi:hypothetical protein
MALDGNYSTLNQANYITSTDEAISSRILVTIPSYRYDTGISAGHVIHYDTVGNRYVKSVANSPSNAEVFGIVESIDSTNSSLKVVTAGSINLPNTFIISNTSSENEGGDDIFFLSATTAGAIENIGPIETGNVVKPIYYKAPHGSFTGLVRNYLGYNANTQSVIDPTPNLITFSQNMSKALEYSDLSKQFYVKTLRYDSTGFLKGNLFYFNKTTLEFDSKIEINFDFSSSNCDAKVSDDGKEVLLFNKFIKKIYYIHIVSPGNASLKHVIDLDIVGNPQDIIWDVDNELSCFTIGTKSLDRRSNISDCKINAHQVSSKIQFYKRNMNSPSPYVWRRTHETHAFGYCESIPREYISYPPSQLALTPGVFRLSDIKCKDKNFVLSTSCSIQDQIDYKSKTSGFFNSKYQGIKEEIFIDSTKLPCGNFISQIDGIGITASQIYGFQTFMGITYNGFTSIVDYNDISQDTAETKKYKCNFGLKQFRILNKINNYYCEDLIHKMPGGIRFFAPYPSLFSSSMNSSTRNNLKKLISVDKMNIIPPNMPVSPGLSPEIDFTFKFLQNAKNSKCYCTENNSYYCLLYEFKRVSDNQLLRKIVIIKFPFNAVDNLNVFNYYEPAVPNISNNGSGYGVICSFYTKTDTESSGDYFFSASTSISTASTEYPSFSTNNNQITQINIDQINDFNFIGNDTRFFIFTSTKCLIYNYSLNSYTIVNVDNFDKASFWSNSDGEFFKLNGAIYKFNSNDNTFEQQTI